MKTQFGFLTNTSGKVKKYFPGLNEAIAKVQNQTVEEDLEHLAGLQGTGNLAYGASDSEVKQELIKQLREDYTYYEDRFPY